MSATLDEQRHILAQREASSQAAEQARTQKLAELQKGTDMYRTRLGLEFVRMGGAALASDLHGNRSCGPGAPGKREVVGRSWGGHGKVTGRSCGSRALGKLKIMGGGRILGCAWCAYPPAHMA